MHLLLKNLCLYSYIRVSLYSYIIILLYQGFLILGFRYIRILGFPNIVRSFVMVQCHNDFLTHPPIILEVLEAKKGAQRHIPTLATLLQASLLFYKKSEQPLCLATLTLPINTSSSSSSLCSSASLSFTQKLMHSASSYQSFQLS